MNHAMHVLFNWNLIDKGNRASKEIPKNKDIDRFFINQENKQCDKKERTINKKNKRLDKKTKWWVYEEIKF